MTTIASWVNRENSANISIWTVGDTKVTNSSSGNVLTLENAKVFELTIRSIDLSTFPLRKVYLNHSIGYAYAGSSLLGLNIFAFLNTLFSNLGSPNNEIPSMDDLANKAAEVVDFHARSIVSSTNPFECLLYGYCLVKNECERYHISREEENGQFKYKAALIPESELAILGDKKDDIKDQISADKIKIGDNNSIEFWRSPLKTIERLFHQKKLRALEVLHN